MGLASIDEILVVTFTNDAAAQMRSKILSALEKLAASSLDDEALSSRLLRQLSLAENADIMSILPRMRVMWYFVGGTCIYYYLYINGLHYKQNNLGMWAWWPLVTFLGIAFITGGSVSRYVLPLQPLFVVIALYVLLQVKIGNYRRSFAIWMAVYVLMLIATLILCYHTQVEYLNSLDEYYRLKAKHLLN